MAEAVEKLGCEAAREFAYFDFAREEPHQRPSQWLTGSLAVELAPQGITVNCVALGYIERPGGPPGDHFRDNPIPLGRAGKPEELTAMVRFLCGPQGRYITGQTIHVNGGWYISVN